MSDWAKGQRFSPMLSANASSRPQTRRPGPAALLFGTLALALAAALLVIGPARLVAQVEGDRGIIPVASSSDIEISGIEVNATGSNGEEARINGWQEAARKGRAEAVEKLREGQTPEDIVRGNDDAWN